jgi:protein-tyrosine phosphatase
VSLLRWFRRPEVTLLVVCSANICRSPAAQVLLTDALKHHGLARRVRVVSAGTSVASPGARPDPRMQALGKELGLSFRGIEARPLTRKALEQATETYVMEPEHLQAIAALAPDLSPGNVMLLDPTGAPIEDPYFGSRADVRRAFEQILRCVAQRTQEWAERLDHG